MRTLCIASMPFCGPVHSIRFYFLRRKKHILSECKCKSLKLMYLRIYRVAKSQTKQHHTVRNTTIATATKKDLEYNYVMCAWLFGLTLASETHVNAHHHQHHHRGRHRCQHRYACGQGVRSTRQQQSLSPSYPVFLSCFETTTITTKTTTTKKKNEKKSNNTKH